MRIVRPITFVAASILAMGIGAPPASASEATGYVVATGTQSVPANNQAGLTVACPANHTVVSGGLENAGDTNQDINSSYPTTSPVGWHVDLNNRDPGSIVFEVFAVCVKRVGSYTVVSSTPSNNLAGQYTSTGAVCPRGTVVFGGGGFSSLGQDSVNTVISAPNDKTSWGYSELNNSSFNGTVTSYAVCGKKFAAYQIVDSAQAFDAPGGQQSVTRECPFLTAPLGGGVQAGVAGDEGLAASYPDGYSWDGAFNNRSGSTVGVKVRVICADAGP